MYLQSLSRTYVPLFALLAAVLLFPSCDRDLPDPTPTYKYILIATHTVGGTVEKSPDKTTFTKDEKVEITPIAKEGYEFTGWTGDVPVGKEKASVLSLTMDTDKTITATFAKKMETIYMLTLTAPKHGKVEGHKATYNKDELTDIKATADQGYYFSKWTGVPTESETQNPLKLKMTQAITLGAVFVQKKASVSHKLTLTAPVNGAVSGNKASYPDGETTDLTAKAASGYAFSHWTGVSDGNKKDNPLKIAMTKDLTLAAVFVKDEEETPTYTLTLTAPKHGKVEGHKETYNKDELTDIMATADEGYYFSKWTGVSQASETQNPLKLKMTKAIALGVVFVQKKASVSHKLTLTAPVNGAVSGDKASYPDGETTEITAKAASGYAFSHWTGVSDGNKKDNPLKIAMTKDLTLAAVFVKTYKLTLTTPNNGTVTKSPDQTTFNSGDTVTLTPNPAAGYEFTGWTGAPSGKEKANPLKLTMDAAKTITATFAKKTYALAVTANPTVGGAVSGNKPTYTQGEVTNITATANAGYVFDKWTGDVPKNQETQNPLKLTVAAKTTLVAEFVKTYTLTLTTPNNGTVTKSPDQTTFKSGETVTLTANPSSGYGFTGWTGAGVPAGKDKDNPLTVTMDAAKTLTATFGQEVYRLTISTPTHGAVAKSPDKANYADGEVVTLTANPSSGYGFISWTGAGVPSGKDKDNPLRVTMDGNKTIGVTFGDPPIYLAANGKTLKAASFTKGGETYNYNGKIYTIAANRAALRNALADGEDMQYYITTKVTDIADLFEGKHTFNDDISAWDVSPVTDMTSMFSGAYAFNQDIGAWDVSNVTDMRWMFSGAHAFNQDISGWKVGSVTKMTQMFNRAYAFDQDIGNWDVSSVTDMESMFSDASAFNQDIGGWKVGNVTDMGGMFYDAYAFNQDIGNWDVSNVTDMRSMFSNASAFNQDIGNWDVSNVTDMERMFSNASAFNQDIGGWKVGQVTDMRHMFYGAFVFNQDIGGWKVGKVTDMRHMFESASAFNQDIGAWDVSSVTDMGYMFYEAAAFNQNIGNWDVSAVTDMENMFENASTFNQDISRWKVGNVTDMGGMFWDAHAFNQDIGAWDVSKVTNMQSMFDQASAFNQDIGGWKVGKVTDMESMFSKASAFNQDLSNWDVSKVTDMRLMFNQMAKFNQDLSGWCVEHLKSKPFLFDNLTPAWTKPKPNWGAKCSSK